MTNDDVLVRPGKVIRQYDAAGAASLATRWLDIFGQDRQGVNTKAYMWHVFSAGRYPNLAAADALMQYRQQSAPEYIVLCNGRDVAFVTDALPQACELRDYYVFPENMAWTMAFTHEDGLLGPYFARHKEYARLNAENYARQEKLKAIDAAKQNGWL